MVDLTYQANVQPEELPGRAWPHVPGEVPQGAFGGEVGRSIEYAGSEVQQHVDAVMKLAQQTQLTDFHNQAQAKVLDLTHNPESGFFTLEGKNAIGAGSQYLQQYDQWSQDAISKIPDQRARQAALLANGQLRNHLSEQIDSHTLEQTRQYAAKTAQTSVELAQQTAAANYNHPDILATNRDHIDASLESLAHQQGWSDEQLAESKYQAHVKMNEGVISNMISDQKVPMAKAYYDTVKGELRPQDRKEFEHAIEAGEVTSSANSILSGYRQDVNVGAKQLSDLEQSSLTPEQQSKVIEQVERGRNELAIQRRADPAIQRQLTNLDASIASGNATLGSVGTVDSLWRRGALTDDQRLSMRDQILRSQKHADDKQQALDFVRDAYTNRTPLDPRDADNKKKVNLYLAETTPPGSVGTPAYSNAAVELTSRVGVVPSGAVDWGRASLVGGDPRQAAAGAQLLASLQRANPRAYEEATDPETRAMAESVNSAVSAGANPEGAVTLARENAQRSKSERKLLDDAWNSQRSPGQRWDTIDSNAIRSGLSGDPNYKEPGFHLGNTVPDVPTPMAAEFADLTKQYFYHTRGNLKQAQALALNDLKGTWGVSEVNGQRQLMKYGPERMFPGLTAEDIRSDVAKEGYGAARLVESPETGSSGGRIWSLAEKDNFGAWDVVRDSRGMPVRYQLPEPKKPSSFEEEMRDYEDRRKLERTQERMKQQGEGIAAAAATGGLGG